MRMKLTSACLTIPAMVCALAATPAFAAKTTLVVDDDFADCPTATFTSIQSAVAAASAGDTIKVCAGTYIEQVTITAGKDGLELRSMPPLAATIKAPVLMLDPKAIVHISGADDVTIRDFTISGPGGSGCDSIRYGIRVDGDGSAKIRGNHITMIHDTPFSGCQNGNAIQIGRQFEGQTGSAEITNNGIDKYQKSGIVVDNVGSNATIRNNLILGVGPTITIAQNGVQVSRGATASVEKNDISDNLYAPMTVVSTGVLLFQPGAAVDVGHNKLRRNDESIFSISAVGPKIQHNDIADNTFDGIGLDDTSGAAVEHNSSEGNGFDGIWVSSTSANNTMAHNKMKNNTEHDAHDDSVGTGTGGTANTWTKNKCGSPNKDNKGGALCK